MVSKIGCPLTPSNFMLRLILKMYVFYLLSSIGLPNPPIEALLSACALGVLHNDFQLSELVLKELKHFERNHLWCHHIAFLTSELYLKKVINYITISFQFYHSQIHSIHCL